MEFELKAARTILAGFDKLYAEFRGFGKLAKIAFEQKYWSRLNEVSRINLSRYDMWETMTAEKVKVLDRRISEMECWERIKKEYIGILYDHLCPELAETFFNSVVGKILGGKNFSNQYYFNRPAVSSENIEGKQKTYHCYYPVTFGFSRVLMQIMEDIDLKTPFSDSLRCLRNLQGAFERWIPGLADPEALDSNFHIQVLTALLFRNQIAYVVGRVSSGYQRELFAICICHDAAGGLRVDALIHDREELSFLFSASHTYFMANIEIPSSWTSFVNTGLVERRKSELYTSIGLQKQGKTLFIRDLSQHLKHSADHFTVAPGVRGMVMYVFTLPSFPFVFKIIRDRFEAPKHTSYEEVVSKYQLIKRHNRVGRLADTLEYVDLALPLSRFRLDLLEELQTFAGDRVFIRDQKIVMKHVYIEQRLTPLNLHLAQLLVQNRWEELRTVIEQFGNTLRDLAATNLFPGDLLTKNFGISLSGRIVFYDYDEVSYLTDCSFREIPEARNEEDENRSEPWYNVNSNDVFPEEFSKFLFSDPRLTKIFEEVHGELLKPLFWTRMQSQLQSGIEFNILPYSQEGRFKT